jgi:hypothetical protein
MGSVDDLLLFFVMSILGLALLVTTNTNIIKNDNGTIDLSNNGISQVANASKVSSENDPSIQPAGGNSTSIFDGKSLDGWQMSGNGTFVVLKKDKSLQSDGGLGILWYTLKEYENFVLEFDWKVSKRGDNSGIFLRFPPLKEDPWVAVREAYEIQINDNGPSPQYMTGAVAGFAAPSNVKLKAPGEWNSMRIEAFDQSYKVFINEEKVVDFIGNRLAKGYLGFQAHDTESKVSYRNIFIKELVSSR